MPGGGWVPGDGSEGTGHTPRTPKTGNKEGAEHREPSVNQSEGGADRNPDAVNTGGVVGEAAPQNTGTDPREQPTDKIPVRPRSRAQSQGSTQDERGPAPSGSEQETDPRGWDDPGSRWRASAAGPLSEERLEAAEGAAEQYGSAGGEAAGGAGSEAPMDPHQHLERIRQEIAGGRDPETDPYREEPAEEEEELARKNVLGWCLDHAAYFAVPVVLLCVIGFGAATLPFLNLDSGEELASRSGTGGGSRAAGETEEARDVPKPPPLYDSGLSFSYSEQAGGKVSISAGGGLDWSGTLRTVESGAGESVEVLDLDGPTAARVSPAFELESGSRSPALATTTVFAVDGEGVPDVHATYHLFEGGSSEGRVQEANGTYDVTDDSGELIAEGTYSDRRTGGAGGTEVVRTYTEQVPGESSTRTFRVRFEAPEGMPIPLLVGWQPPEERPVPDYTTKAY